MRWFIAAVLCVIVSAHLVGQDVVLQQKMRVAEMQPIVVHHEGGGQLSVKGIGVGDPPEQQYRRFSDFTVFTAEPGDYLLQVDDKYSIITITPKEAAPSQVAPTNSPQPVAPHVYLPPEKIEKPLRIWAYMGANCVPCESWKQNELPLLRSQPDLVDVYVLAPGSHTKPRTPTFIIQVGDKVVEREGYQADWNTAKTLLAEIQK